jgi:hypothetical protein
VSTSTAIRAAAALALCALAIAGCGGGGSSSTTTTQQLSTCNINGRQQLLGASYVTTIQVAKVSCGQAAKVVFTYHQCRKKNGGPGGTCHTAVLGFTCTEGPRQAVPGVQFNADVTCRKGPAEVKSSYTQNF